MKIQKILKTYVLKFLEVDCQAEEPSEENGWTYGTARHYKDNQHGGDSLVAFITDNGRYILLEKLKADSDSGEAWDSYETEAELMKAFYRNVDKLKSKEYWTTQFDMFPPVDDDMPCEIKVPRLLKLDGWTPNREHHHFTSEWAYEKFHQGDTILEEIEPFTAHYEPNGNGSLIQGSLL